MRETIGTGFPGGTYHHLLYAADAEASGPASDGELHVEKVNSFSTYHVHHRVAQHFRKGRAFLLGDSAHIHNPVGGQGMNPGISDAINLAWKLRAVLGAAHPMCFCLAVQARGGWVQPRYGISGAAGYVHWPC